ncbi:hypothetical protein Atep_02250 [Allochromatium tepidum]|uniref:Uncharacterized protein n=1 Tax=Allochromatium tepidum TaxID=553982 RepID=A0ABM7QIJ8_9GAMM|nr:hypothetical protein Atep_02250 [Allochromatium tepidum]
MQGLDRTWLQSPGPAQFFDPGAGGRAIHHATLQNGVTIMANGSSLAAMELMVFLGLVGWLLYYQYSNSRSDSSRTQSSDETPKESD